VRVCVPEPLRDVRYTGLDLSAGWHDLDGVTALAYVRARHVDGGDGTDPARIERQHRFLGALVRKVLSSDVLASPLATGRFLDAVTSSLTVSAELADTGTMLGLGWSLRALDATDLTFLTVPWAYADGGRYVAWTPDAADVWARLLADQPLSGSDPGDGAATGDGALAAGDAVGSPPVAGAGLSTAEDAQAVACG
jgi:anionic cell wall polymer biosynthesis LytR-Cps2A-Psr (LCP) family protein